MQGQEPADTSHACGCFHLISHPLAVNDRIGAAAADRLCLFNLCRFIEGGGHAAFCFYQMFAQSLNLKTTDRRTPPTRSPLRFTQEESVFVSSSHSSHLYHVSVAFHGCHSLNERKDT